MRGRAIGMACVAAALCSCSGGGPTTGGGDAVLLAVQDDPTVTFAVWFEVGSNDDPPGKEGLAFLTGQMLAEASTQRNAYDEVLRKLYPLAADYRIRVDHEMTVLTGRTHRDNLEPYFELFADAYLRPAFLPEDFARLKADSLNSIRNALRYQDDEELGKAALRRLAYEGSGYAHPLVGTVSGVESITLDDVKAFHRDYFTADRTHVALGGSFADELVRRFDATRRELPPRGAPRRPLPNPERPDGTRVLLVAKPGESSSISFGHPIEVRRGDDDFYALWVANSWLGEHRSSASHLFQVIREKRGLNYGDYSYVEGFPEGGRRQVPPTNVARSRQLFEVWIRTLPDAQGPFALRAALREVQALIDDGLSDEEFGLTREFLPKYVLHFADTTRGRLGYAIDDRFYGIEGDGHLARFRERMGELTRAEVNAAVGRHLRHEDLYVAIVTGDAERWQAVLTSGEPSPIEYATPKAAEILAEDREIAAFPLRVEADRIRVVAVDELFE